MNAFTIIMIIYALVTLGAVSILYFSFKGRIDVSGKYFLLAELLMLMVQVQVILTSLDPIYRQPIIFFLANWLYISSDIAILFSLYALKNQIKIDKYIVSIFVVAIYCISIELVRTDIAFPTLMYGAMTSAIAFATYAICQFNQTPSLKNNLFLRWITYLELAIACFGLLRVASYFMGAPIMPRVPSTANILLYSLFSALCIFRYFSYQSLRISWVDPRANQTNPLNKNLARAIEEKDNLLRGLIASNRVIGISALASSLSHQLSQPLTAIGLQTETLKRDLIKSGKDEKTVVALDKMSLQLARLSGLVKNLRQLFNARNYAFDAIDLQTITDELLEIIEPTLNAKKIHLTKTFHSNPVILGDAIQIQQVLINLFNNAIDAIANENPEHREIKLTIDSDNQFAVISIKDTGAGIDATVLPTIFELYKTTKAEGLGVGLWLSKTIIDKHHGSIAAANSADDGAVFTVQIPLAEKTS